RVFYLGLGYRTFRVHQQRNDVGFGYHLAHQLQPFLRQHARHQPDAGDIPARPVETGDKAELDRVGAGDEDDRDRRVAALIATTAGGANAALTAACRSTKSASIPG